MKNLLTAVIIMGALVFVAGPAVQGDVFWHDPYLNWHLDNLTGANVNDLSVWVDNPNGKFNPPPAALWADVFPNIVINPTGQADHDGDGDLDTEVKYMNPIGPVLPGQTAHGGIYMKESGKVIDAYWTWNCAKVGKSIPVTYELTEIRGDPEVHMHLQINPGYFKEEGIQEAGWTNIRTFVDIPADLLGLPNLYPPGVEAPTGSGEYPGVDLSTLTAYKVTAQFGGVDITPATVIMQGEDFPVDSFFDIFLADIPPENASPAFESLLVATVIDGAGVPQGQFWNLNPLSPEPGTLMLLAAGAGFLLRRRRRRNT